MFIEIVTVATFLLVCFVIFLIGDAISAGHRTGRNKNSKFDERGVNYYKTSKVGVFSRALAGVIPQSSQEISKIELDLKRAGYYRSTALVEYLATRNMLVVLVLIASMVNSPNSSIPICESSLPFQFQDNILSPILTSLAKI